MIWLITGISLAGAVLYRLGGKKGYNTLYRDMGVSLCICAILGLLGGKNSLFSWLSLIPCLGLQWGALTTYRYWLPKPTDYGPAQYALHGFMVALSAFPFAWASGHWVGLILRCIVCAGAMYGWYYLAKWSDDLHEGGRGLILTASTPLIFLV